jgi:hypothetical protein
MPGFMRRGDMIAGCRFAANPRFQKSVYGKAAFSKVLVTKFSIWAGEYTEAKKLRRREGVRSG